MLVSSTYVKTMLRSIGLAKKFVQGFAPSYRNLNKLFGQASKSCWLRLGGGEL